MRVMTSEGNPTTFLRHVAEDTTAHVGLEQNWVVVQFDDAWSGVTYEVAGPIFEVREVLVEALDALDRLGVGL